MSVQTETPSAPPLVRPSVLQWLAGLGLIAIVFFVYQSVKGAGFIWDDAEMLTQNGTVVGPFGLKEIWTTPAADICPFTLTTLWLAHKFFGLDPMPYHLLTVAFHAAGAVVLWRVLRALAVPGAWLGAAIWAVHPVQVESVAWIAEIKNTESGFFYLLSILFFVKWRKAGPVSALSDYRYILALLFAVLAMTSKSSTVILPIELCLIAWWIDRGLRVTDVFKLAPIFVFAAVATVVSIWTQHVRGADNAEWVVMSAQHLQIAGGAIWFYLGKLLWPYPLMMIYPEGTAVPDVPFQYFPLIAALGGLIILWVNRKTWGRPWFFAAAYFMVALLPVLGFVNNIFFEYSPIFDHFQYLASMAPLALVGAGVAWVGRKMEEDAPIWIPAAMGILIMMVLGISTLRYSQVFESETTLWNYVLSQNPNCWPAYTNLAIQYNLNNQPADGKRYLEKALEIHPHNAQAQYDVGVLLQQEGQIDKALEHFRAAIEISPKYPHPHASIGDILAAQGKYDEAIQEYQKALDSAPNDPKTQVSMGVVLAQQGRGQDALPHFQKALSLDPKNAEAHYNVGNMLFASGMTDDAISELRIAEGLNPNDYRIHNNLGRALAVKGWMDEALTELRKAQEELPNDVAIRQNLGRMLAAKGETDEGIAQLREAVKLDDHNAKSHNLLGTFLQESQKLDDAIVEYKKALDIDPAFAEARRNLGVCYFLQGKIDDAQEQFERCIAVDPGDALAHNGLGIIYGQKGQLDKAKDEFQQALEYRPGFDDAQQNLKRVQALLAAKGK
jgi:Flp pilus assembly protein TadD